MSNTHKLHRPGRRDSLRGGCSARSLYRAMPALGLAACMGLTVGSKAMAFNLYSGSYAGKQLEINLNTTVEYSNIFRVNNPSKILTSSVNNNDGDLNFQHGLVDNTFGILPVFDVKYGNYGVHVSGEAYIDTPYLNDTQNNSPNTYNPYTVSNRHFTSATRNVNGLDALLLDAFVYGTKYFGANDQQSLTVKFGRQTLLWGQSLYFTNNGIAAGMAPIDVIKAQSLPNPQTQQVIMPVNQAVVTYSPNQTLTFQAYYQLEWEPDRLEGVGAYFNGSDVLDKGGQRIIVPLGSTNYYLYRVKDLRPPINNGQFGVSVQDSLGNCDVGLYALRYDSKTPEVYTGVAMPGGGPNNIESYWAVYPRDIQLYGASLSTTLLNVNWGAEVSGRRNMPLVTNAAPFSDYPGSANAGALYPVGSTFAAQLSWIYLSPALPLDPDGATFTGEIAMNHLLSVDKNKAALAPGRDSTAGVVDFSVSPTYDNVLPSLSLQFPIGINYNLFGRSQIDSTMNHGTGTLDVGVTAIYRQNWTATLNYQDYLGRPDPTLNSIADRGYVSFNIQHTF